MLDQRPNDVREIELAPGTIRYRDTGSGPPIVFVHGLLVNGGLWRKVVPHLTRDFRCIVPDLPLGAHARAMRPDADLSPLAIARVIADFLAALDLHDVTLVGNDTGGALCQLVVTRHPERIGRLVLTPCDAFDNFPPRLFDFLLLAARVPPVLNALLQTMRIGFLARSPIGFGLLAKHRLDDATLAAYSGPVLRDADVRRDLAKALRGLDRRLTQEAATKLGAFRKPTLLAWAPEDRLFPFAHAERLAQIFPDARIARVDDSYTFVPEDQPERLAELIAAFVTERGAARPHAGERRAADATSAA